MGRWLSKLAKDILNMRQPCSKSFCGSTSCSGRAMPRSTNGENPSPEQPKWISGGCTSELGSQEAALLSQLLYASLLGWHGDTVREPCNSALQYFQQRQETSRCVGRLHLPPVREPKRVSRLDGDNMQHR
eukprot:776368-Amphidinium_carterae.1